MEYPESPAAGGQARMPDPVSGYPYPAAPPVFQPGGWPPPGAPGPQSHQAGPPPADKSVGVALVLTFLFGSLGLFYSSIIGGIVMTVISFFLFLLALATFGFLLPLFLLIWPITMVWGAVSASRQHRDFEIWRMRVGPFRVP